MSRASEREIVSPRRNFWTAQGARGRSDWKRRSEPTNARAVSASILSGKAAALPIGGAALLGVAVLAACKAGLQCFGRQWAALRSPSNGF